ncbi:MAG TPA: RNA-directed DNA polymerase [Myxococcota bacterium]|nr:RNA-directed DNA polymerase [Myxococcota bacterium]
MPIGNLTSQWWGNVYLDGLDHYVCRSLRVGAYQRYMDDITLFGNDREVLLDQREAIAVWLGENRALSLKDPLALPRSTLAPVPYLGHVIRPTGIFPGRKARGRLPRNIRIKNGNLEKIGQTLRSFRAFWMFGS